MQAKRKEIIEKSIGLIHKNGYGKTSLKDILRVSEVGKGQFYYYFSSKEELGFEILEYAFNRWYQNVIKNIFQSSFNPEQKIVKMLEYIIQCHEKNDAKNGCIFGNLAIELSEDNENFRVRIRQIFEVWISELDIVLKELIGIGNKVPASSIVAMIEGGILLMKNYQDINVLVDISKTIKQILKI